MKRIKKTITNHPYAGLSAALALVVLLYLILSNLGSILDSVGAVLKILNPVITGLVIAYIIEPLVKLVQRLVAYLHIRRHSRTIAVIVSLSLLIVFVVILFIAMIPQLVDSAANLISNADTYLSSLQNLLKSLSKSLSQTGVGANMDISGVIQSVQDLAAQTMKYLTSNVGQIINTSYYIGANIMDWVIAFILAIYFLMDKARLMRSVTRFIRAILPGRFYESFFEVAGRCNRILVRFIACEILDALIVGFTNYLIMRIFFMPYASLISVVVGVTNLAPTFGPFVGGAIGTFILVLIEPWAGLGFLLLTFLLQMIDGYVIKPKLYGYQLNVPSVLIMISIIVGARVMGVSGILLAIPFAAILSFLYGDYLLPRLERRRRRKDEREEQEAEDIEE